MILADTLSGLACKDEGLLLILATVAFFLYVVFVPEKKDK